MTVSCHESRDLLGMGRGAALVALQKRCVNVKHTSGAILVEGWGSGIVVSFVFLRQDFMEFRLAMNPWCSCCHLLSRWDDRYALLCPT